jgi:hypothetical protein
MSVMMSENNYWENRYSRCGTSGAGSIGVHREWKWRIITSFLPLIDQVVDVGCGDLSFWEGRDCSDYIGIDISEAVITRNRTEKPEWIFYVSPAENYIQDIKRSCVFCFDMLFHITNTDIFLKILNNICRYSSEYLFIYTWMENPFTKKFWLKRFLSALTKFNLYRGGFALRNMLSNDVYTDGVYQYFRPLEKYNCIFSQYGFRLVNKKKNPNDFGGMYIYRLDPV